MASSVSYKDGDKTCVINAEQIAYCFFRADGTVSIQFTFGEMFDFKGMSDRERDALKRALKINPA